MQSNGPTQEPATGVPHTGRRTFLIALAGAGLWLSYTRIRGTQNATSTNSIPDESDVPEAFRAAWRSAESLLGSERAASLAVLAADLLPPSALDDGSERITADFSKSSAVSELQHINQVWDVDPDQLELHRVFMDNLANAARTPWKEIAPKRRTKLLQSYFDAYAHAAAASRAAEERAPDDPAELGQHLILLRDLIEIGFWEQPGLRPWMQARACETNGPAQSG